MALKPPTQEQSLLELLRDSLRKAVRTWWHRRRRPKFGDAITHEAPAQGGNGARVE